MTVDRSEGVSEISVCLFVEKVQPELDFLVSAFEATILEQRQTDTGELTHATTRLGKSLVVVEKAKGTSPGPSCEFYAWTENIDVTLRKAIEAGATSLAPITTSKDGIREATVRDRSGVTWRLNQETRKPSTREVERRLQQQRKARL